MQKAFDVRRVRWLYEERISSILSVAFVHDIIDRLIGDYPIRFVSGYFAVPSSKTKEERGSSILFWIWQ